MADILMTSDLLTIGTDYAPNCAVNKYITLSNVNVTGTALVPEKTAVLRCGFPGRICKNTVVDGVQAIVDPAATVVDTTARSVHFTILLQIKFHTGDVHSVETRSFSALCTANICGQMDDFILSPQVAPHIKCAGPATVIESLNNPSLFELQVLLTTGSFYITASGLANVRVPLGISAEGNCCG